MKAFWGIGLLLLVIAAIFLANPAFPACGRPQAIPIKKTMSYRPSETMGSNAVSFRGLDTKALCAVTDRC
jgi:hypothetical protein